MKVIKFKKFDGIGAKVDYATLLKRRSDACRIELFSHEHIIKLNIRFDEVFHKCTDSEWADFQSRLINAGVPIKQYHWWKFWDC